MRFSLGEPKREIEGVVMAMAATPSHSLLELVLMFFILIGGVLFSNDKGSRLLGEGDLVVIGLGGELGESFGE